MEKFSSYDEFCRLQEAKIGTSSEILITVQNISRAVSANENIIITIAF